MTKLSVTELPSAVITDNRLADAMRKGRVVSLPDADYVLAPTTAIAALADDLAEEELLAEMVSYRKNVTGVDNTVFISPKGKTRHAARIKLAIDLPDSINPASATASIAISDGAIVDGEPGDIPPGVLAQARRFIAANREALLDYWEYRIDTEALRERLRSV
jgi:hypothetical protein